MKKITKLTSLACLLMTLFLASSCGSYKKVPYILNSQEVDLSTATLFDARIMPKDILTISVTCPEDPRAAAMFNLVLQAANPNSSTTSMSSQYQVQQYIVTNEGTIEFPVLGKLHVAGKTKTELENEIAEMVTGPYLKTRPIVLVNMANYKVAVIGEVGHSGIFTAANGKMNIFEALAQAGDMTIYGRRDNVKIIREDAKGAKQIVEVNLNDANIINSPYYQLQQNDIVYVTPNKPRAMTATYSSATTIWITVLSSLLSMTNLIVLLTKRI